MGAADPRSIDRSIRTAMDGVIKLNDDVRGASGRRRSDWDLEWKREERGRERKTRRSREENGRRRRRGRGRKERKKIRRKRENTEEDEMRRTERR